MRKKKAKLKFKHNSFDIIKEEVNYKKNNFYK